MSSSTLRVATLNVHGWHNEERDSWDLLVQLLSRVNADVIALQEATKHRVPALAAALEAATGGGTQYHWLCRSNCAILSRFALKSTAPGQVSGVGLQQQGRSPSKVEQRKMCKTRHCVGSICWHDDTWVEVVCVHPSHVREPTRLSEVANLVVYLQENGGMQRASRHTMLGDFNALTRADYTQAEWGHIADVRARNAWEAPVSELTDVMTRSPTKRAPLGLQMHRCHTT